MTSTDALDVSLDDIEQTTFAALVGHGASQGIAQSVARAVRRAEQTGNRICGLYYVESYCQQLRTGRVDGMVEPVVQHDQPGAVRVDARFGFAQPAFDAGFDATVSAARTAGTASLSIEHSHTATALGYFTERFAEAGLLALGATNATARVAPPGGAKRLLGTNPMSFAVPGPDGDVALVFDYSTSATALGKITMANAAGESIPEGWAIDASGNPTTDAAAALEGSLLSAGGYKGYGLGLMVEVLAAGLTGSRISTDIAPLKSPDGPPHDIGQFYVVIDPDAFAGAGFHERVAAIAELVAADGDARMPGANRPAPTSVSVPSDTWSLMTELAAH